MTKITRRTMLKVTLAAPMIGMALPARAATHQLSIENMKFVPDTLAVAVGDTVVVTNTGGTHTCTALDGSFDTGKLKKGQSAEIIISVAGDHPYHCAIHTSMKGAISAS